MTPNHASEQAYAEPPQPDPGCVHCGGKGYIETVTKYNPPLRFGPDEFCDQSILSRGCECIWANCPTCGYSYWRRDGHQDCLGFNPYAEEGDESTP